MPDATCDWLTANRDSVDLLQIAGGVKALPEHLVDRLKGCAGGDPGGDGPPEVERVGGVDRLHTSVLIAEYNFPDARQASFASGGAWPDAVTGAALAVGRGDRSEGPILLTARTFTPPGLPFGVKPPADDAVEQVVFDYVCTTLPAPEAEDRFVLGGEVAVSDVKEDAIVDMGSRCPVGPSGDVALEPPGPFTTLRPPSESYAGDDIVSAINAGAEGQVFVLEPGLYRIDAPIRPKRNQQIHGEDGAVVTGAVPVDPSAWTRVGTGVNARWWAESPGRRFCVHGNYDDPTALFAEDLYTNKKPMAQQLYDNDNGASLRPGEFAIAYDTPNGRGTGDQVPVAETLGSPGNCSSGLDPNYKTGGADGYRDILWVAENPADLAPLEVNATVQGIRAADAQASGVTVSNLDLYGFGNRAQSGAVDGRATTGWTLSHLDVSLAHGTGVQLGPNSTLRDSRVHDNGQMGLGAGPSSGPALASGIVVERNELAANNWAGYDLEWEAGGAKLVGTGGALVARNHAHHNNGAGLWTDIDNQATTYLENLSTDNQRSGIWHEISFDAQIIRNTAARNGYWSADRTDDFYSSTAGIFIASSDGLATNGITISGNIVRHNSHGIAIAGQRRDEDEQCCSFEAPANRQGKRYQAEFVFATDNLVDHTSDPTVPPDPRARPPDGQSGLQENLAPSAEPADRPYFELARATFDNNRYRGVNEIQFAWRGKNIDAAMWRGCGHDTGPRSTFNGLREQDTTQCPL